MMNEVQHCNIVLHSGYIAVKHSKSAPPSNETPPTKQLKIQTRTCSVLPKDEELKEKCFFCGNNRKKN